MKLNIEDFKLKARLEELDDEIIIDKQFDTEVESMDNDTREITFVISTNSKDRDGDIISVDGWELDNWRKNPVVLWGHDYAGLPIGIGTKIWASDDRTKLYATVKFVESEIYPFADVIYRMVKSGYIRTTSVGFKPKEWKFIEDTDDGDGMEFMRQELLEFSVVSVPANPEALVAAGADKKSFQDYVKGVSEWLDGFINKDVEFITGDRKTTDTGDVEATDEMLGDGMVEDSSDTADVAEVVETESEEMVIIVDDGKEEMEEEVKSTVAEAFKMVFKQMTDDTDAYRELKKTGKIGG